MRKSISVTNESVKYTLNNCTNASELIEVAIMYYLGVVNKDYVEMYKKTQKIVKALKDYPQSSRP